jgi:hypothetical protein
MQVLLAAILATYIGANPPLSRHDIAIGGDTRNTLVAWTAIENGAARVHVGLVTPKTDVVLPMTGQMQFAPALAFDGRNYLAVWNEVITGQTVTFAMRIASWGDPLDRAPILLGAAGNVPPRVVWHNGLYYVATALSVVTINTAGVAGLPVRYLTNNANSMGDVALAGDTPVFLGQGPSFCHGFSFPVCDPGPTLITFGGGTSYTPSSKPQWLEANETRVIWSDGKALYELRGGVNRLAVTQAARSAAVAGSLLVFDSEGTLYALDLDKRELPVALTDSPSAAPSLLALGDGRYLLAYRTVGTPAQLIVRTLTIKTPGRRHTT